MFNTRTHTHTVAVCLYSMYCRCDVFSTPAGLSRLCSLLHVSSSVESVLLYCLTAQSIEKSIAFFFGGSGDSGAVKEERWSFAKGKRMKKMFELL